MRRRPPRPGRGGRGRRRRSYLSAGRRRPGALAEPLLEPGDAAAGVEDLLLAGVERVALRADLGVDDAVGRGAAGGERVAAASRSPWSRCTSGWMSGFMTVLFVGGRRVAGRAWREPEPRSDHVCQSGADAVSRVPRSGGGPVRAGALRRPSRPPRRLATGRGRRGAQSFQLVRPGVVFAICIRNSTLVRVCFSRSSSRSSACCGSSACSTRRSLMHDRQLVGRQQDLLLAGAGRVDVDRREDPLVGDLAVELELGVTGALELLEDHRVHRRAGLDQRRGDDRQRAAVLDVAGRAEEPLRRVQRGRVDTTGQDAAADAGAARL